LREALASLDNERLLPWERERWIGRIRSTMTGLWQMDLMRPRRPTVLAEVEVGLYFATTLWEVIPVVFRDFQSALEKTYQDTPFHLPSFLRLGAWIGGDRDGNPNVTAAVMEQTLLKMRKAAVQAHLDRCGRVLGDLTPSDREVPVSEELTSALERYAARYPGASALFQPISPFEIYRRFLKVVQWRLSRTAEGESLDAGPQGAYTDAGELAGDLTLIGDSLRANRGTRILEEDLGDWKRQAETFGFHMARLDTRQESSVISRVLGEIFRAIGLASGYGELPEEEKRALLNRTMAYQGSIHRDGLSPEVVETLSLVSLLSRASSSIGEAALGGFVISMTHDLSDVLAVLWLFACREPASRAGAQGLRLGIIPLFETIEDLENAHRVLDAMFGDPCYRGYLARRGSVQTVMIGYSDSTKDGGYLAACWA
jgi:phosphoenolpyruvate carboxylase